MEKVPPAHASTPANDGDSATLTSSRRRNERYPAAKEHRDDTHFHGIDDFCSEQTSKQQAAAE